MSALVLLAAEAGVSALEAVGEGRALVPAQVFAKGNVEMLVAKIEAEVRGEKRDISTLKGRAAVRSLAYKVARSKTALDEMGKELTQEWRQATDAVNADRRLVRDRLEALADEVRGPLERWEAKDKARVAAHEAALMDIMRGHGEPNRGTSVDIAARLVELRDPAPRDWQEFEERAAEAYAAQIAFLEGLLEERKAEEAAEAAEAARLAARIEEERLEAERHRQEREAEIAAQAAEAARLAAEQRAAKALAEAEAKRQAEADAAERAAQRAAEEARDREAMLRAGQEREMRAAADALAAAEAKRQADASAAQARLAAAEQKARDDAHQAVVAERIRVDEERMREAKAAEARAKDRAHRGAINRAAADALEAAGLTPEQAKAVVTLIASNAVPAVRINY